MSAELDRFLSDLPAGTRSLLEHVLAMVRAVAPGVSADVDGPRLRFGPRDRPVLSIWPLRSHVTVGFHQGATLRDPKRLLQGQLEGRHLRVARVEQLDDRALRALIFDATRD